MSIDWAEIEIKVPRPVLFVHGIFSGPDIWTGHGFNWPNQLNSLGIPYSNDLDMGWLDSIGDNAQKIAAKIEALKRRWGVDKINVVSHSKGGIDGRHFVEYNDSVERLFQIGTPNAGSPLADYAQRFS